MTGKSGAVGSESTACPPAIRLEAWTPPAAPRPARSEGGPPVSEQGQLFKTKYSAQALSKICEPPVEAALTGSNGQTVQSCTEAVRGVVNEILASSSQPEALYDLETHCLERSHALAVELEARGIPVRRTQVGFHVFLVVNPGPDETIIDPTYLQFVADNEAQPKKVIFVGTRAELESVHTASGTPDAQTRVAGLYGYARPGMRNLITKKRAQELVD